MNRKDEDGAKTVQKLNIQDKLGVVTVKNTFCDLTDFGKLIVCSNLKDLLSFKFQSNDI